MGHVLEQVGAELAHIVDGAEIRLRQVSEEESGQPALPGGWSRKQLLGHLIESASNNHQRFVRAALADALEFPAYDTPGSVRVQAAESARWPMLVDLWASYNRYLAHVIRHPPLNWRSCAGSGRMRRSRFDTWPRAMCSTWCTTWTRSALPRGREGAMDEPRA